MANKEKPKFETTEGVAKKIYNGFTKGAIKFGELKDTSDKDTITRDWISEALPNGAVVKFGMSHKQGKNKNGKKYNPRYKIMLAHKEEEQEFSGLYARKIYNRLMKPPRKRTTVLTDAQIAFSTDALKNL